MPSTRAEVGDERATERTGEGLDRLSIAELASMMNDADASVPTAVRAALPSIVAAIEAIVDRLDNGGRLFYVGAGTSGRLGVLDASELPPTFGVDADAVVAIIAGGVAAVTDAQEGAEDDTDAGRVAMDDAGVTAGDAVVGIASSGTTPYVLAAVRRAGELGAATIGLSCSAETPLSGACDHPIEVLVGPEIVAGSTRLKAGTAQKLVLNMLSTITMVRLGRTYDDLMVDLRPTNDKLRARAARIVAQITGADASRVDAALIETEWDVKAAVLVAARGLDAQSARRRLDAAGGRLRDALEGP